MAIFNTVVLRGGGGKAGTAAAQMIGSLTAEQISRCAKMISDNSRITKDTEAVLVYDGEERYLFRIGDEVTTTGYGGETYLILGFNHDSLETADAYGAVTATGKAGITLQMKDCFGVKLQMGSAPYSWDSCALRGLLRDSYASRLPEEWQGIIKPVIKSTAVSASGEPALESSETLFLLDETEVFGKVTYSNPTENSQYAWYKAGGSAIKDSTGWWLRSAYAGNSSYCCSVSMYGGASYTDITRVNDNSYAFCV